jgi:predicted transcriptional regulator of viral defense system
MSLQLNWKVLKQLAQKERFGFTLQDVADEFPEKNRVHLASLLSRMVEQGMISKIDRNIYHIIPLESDPASYFPDSLQVAKYMMLGKEYYLGYASAMKIHGLTKSSGNLEYVVTRRQKIPAIRHLHGMTCQFIQHDTSRFSGFESFWINQKEEAMVSDLEKTIVDIATRPGFCGGITAVGKAIHKSRDQTDPDKLFTYFAQNKNKSARKRFLFLADLLDLTWTSYHDRLGDEIGTGITLLDPTVPDQGKIRKEFGLKVNVDPASIKKEILDHKINP